MYNDELVYKVVIWVFFGISLWKEKVALKAGHFIYEHYGNVHQMGYNYNILY